MPSLYQKLAQYVCERANARGAAICVLDGTPGTGFEVVLRANDPDELRARLPELLVAVRALEAEIEIQSHPEAHWQSFEAALANARVSAGALCEGPRTSIIRVWVDGSPAGELIVPTPLGRHMLMSLGLRPAAGRSNN